MGYMSVAKLGMFSVTADKGLWLYTLLAAPLMIVTMGVLAFCELVVRRHRTNPSRSQHGDLA